MLAILLLIVMYLWASATIGLIVFFVDNDKKEAFILGLIWPVIPLILITVTILELFNRGRY